MRCLAASERANGETEVRNEMSEWLMLAWRRWLTLVWMVLMNTADCRLTKQPLAEALESFSSGVVGKLLTLSRQMALNELSGSC